ncbi:ABC-type glutathione transport system ATPase component [Paenarthrobacter nicotinovorans]|uniref:ABC-type glutathione transport system ATPase component n=1 Tax=Paenarthrobacter nicotinovorans TaxID=29320 RepID=A0ABT9TVF7_PAENI|nr:ATP-binding cassette domain-containing protein [Paenarthrobacter nicotinovorans]MDQ0104367.1 ABC-type glutathione transport system ATPase component [Paenarthrobacter nicotinovorans]
MTAVSNVSFDVYQGDSVGIVGESGSGKTTIARMIMGLQSPNSGRIEIDGHVAPARSSWKERRRLARRVQMVFQDPSTSLDPRQSALEAIDEVQRVHFERNARERSLRTQQLLDACGLSKRVGTARPANLSGGQRQRVAIARALAAEPSALVLDEAVSALDVSVQAQILNVLADLREEFGLTYLFISHDLAVVRFLCENVVVLRSGHLIETGRTDDVFDTPQNDYTRDLVAAIPRVPHDWTKP